MLLMEAIYEKLRQEQLVDTAEDFSENWCGVQKCSNGVHSIAAEIVC